MEPQSVGKEGERWEFLECDTSKALIDSEEKNKACEMKINCLLTRSKTQLATNADDPSQGEKRRKTFHT